jgi:hypothetical protein
MTEKEIQDLGFERINEESNPPFYYYTKDLISEEYGGDSGLSLISCSDSDTVNGEWYVEIFNTYPNRIIFRDISKVKELIKLIKDHTTLYDESEEE